MTPLILISSAMGIWLVLLYRKASRVSRLQDDLRDVEAENMRHQVQFALIREHVERHYPGRWKGKPIDEMVRLALQRRHRSAGQLADDITRKIELDA